MPEKPASKSPKDSSKSSQTDWERLARLSDEEIDTSDIPEPTPEQFAQAVLRKGLKPVAPKRQVTLRLDADVLEWFKHQGKGYQTRINALLRAYMEAHRGRK
jgi:uncharacterized protein (DUF4415 family)